MEILGQSNMNDETYDGFTKKEKASQVIMDKFYTRMGWNFDRSGACKEYDLIINDVLVEEKFIYNDCDNILIEIIQNVISNRYGLPDLGWYYKTKAGWLFFIVEHKYLYAIVWLEFKEWFENELKNRQYNEIFKTKISIKGFGYTINLAVERDDIPKELYRLFNLNSF
jgi:hypothetical protein